MRGDKKEQKEERGCGVLARTRARSWLQKSFDASKVVLFHPGEQRAPLGTTALCLAGSAVTW